MTPPLAVPAISWRCKSCLTHVSHSQTDPVCTVPRALRCAPQAEAYSQRERSVRSLLSDRFRSLKDTGASLDMKVSGGLGKSETSGEGY